MEKKNCKCCSGSQLIFACSGAADVGTIADQAARKLTEDGVGQMFCLAGVGGRVSAIMKTTGAAAQILAIDGCPLNCVEKCLQEAGFTDFEHLQLADLGMMKGDTEVNEANIAQVAAKGAELIA